MLTQAEADHLINLPKRLETQRSILFPAPGDKATYHAVSLDQRERFMMDANRGRIRLTKCSYQQRYRTVEVLLRLCVDGPPHPNPDGEVIHGHHIHVYREGYGSRWAIPLPSNRFGDPTDLARTLRDFLAFCNVENPPEIQMSFS